MRHSSNRVFSVTAYLAFAAVAWICLGLVARADDDKPSDSGAAIADVGGGGNIVIGGNEVGTATSSNLKGQARLEEAIGRREYFKSLSAINLQKAIDVYLANERQRIESYYEVREYRDERVAAERNPVSEEIAIRRAKEAAPDRLTSQDYDTKTGKVFWPDPLDDKVLNPYTKVINEAFAKRSDPGQVYRGSDARRVQRMIKLMQSAVDSIKEELPVREYIALTDYLNSVTYEAYFDSAGNRVINSE